MEEPGDVSFISYFRFLKAPWVLSFCLWYAVRLRVSFFICLDGHYDEVWSLMFLVILKTVWAFVAHRHFDIVRSGVLFHFAELKVLLSRASFPAMFLRPSLQHDSFCFVQLVAILMTGVQVAHNHQQASP